MLSVKAAPLAKIESGPPDPFPRLAHQLSLLSSLSARSYCTILSLVAARSCAVTMLSPNSARFRSTMFHFADGSLTTDANGSLAMADVFNVVGSLTVSDVVFDLGSLASPRCCHRERLKMAMAH